MELAQDHFSILVVGNSPIQTSKLKSILSRHAFAVITAANGRNAMDIIAASPPSLVICDIFLPGMSGYELCTAIRTNRETCNLPVVLVLTRPNPKAILLASECRANGLIFKPFNEKEILSRLQGILQDERLTHAGDDQRIFGILFSSFETMESRNKEQRKTLELLRRKNRDLKSVFEDLTISMQNMEFSLEELFRRETVIDQWHAELKMVNNIETEINQYDNADEILTLVCDKLASSGLFGIGSHVKIRLAHDDTLHCCHHSSSSGVSRPCSISSEGEYLCGSSFQQGSLYAIPETIHGVDCLDAEEREGRVAIPLRAKDKVVGVLCLATILCSELDESQLELLESLGRQVGMAIEHLRLFNETRRLSLYDPLTGLANRRMLEIGFNTRLARAKRFSNPFCTLLIDIDHFKKYNDTYGHDAGDRILAQTAGILQRSVRDTDLAARFGGEEFVLLLSDAALETAVISAEKIRETVAAEVGITISIGVAQFLPEDSYETLIKSADEALYDAKRNGRNRVKTAPMRCLDNILDPDTEIVSKSEFMAPTAG